MKGEARIRRMVLVPGPLLLDPRLTESAKLLWMVYQLEPQASVPKILERRAGLGRQAVLRGLAQLQATGWLPAPTGLAAAAGAGSHGAAAVPGELLLDRRLEIRPRVLYAYLQLTPGLHEHRGQFTYPGLSRLTGADPKSLRRSVAALQAAGWVKAAHWGKFSPVRFTLRNPVRERQEAAVLAASRRLEEAPFIGEALMREYLTLIADSDEYIDNARPNFLVNPYTDEVLEFDRYYPPRVAFEFNGPQHYGPTAQYPKDAWKQQGRDYVKGGICLARGISLVVVCAPDLTLAGMRQKVEGVLPLRDLRGRELLIDRLETASEPYRRRARQ